MRKTPLSLNYDQLSQEYLLVAAWKKAHDFIRNHNWYADVLDLDLTNASINRFIRDLAAEIRCTESLSPSPLRIVLAPKSQEWSLKDDKWNPCNKDNSKLRPLAHLQIRDQVIATCLMILLANAVETRQGDPQMEYVIANREGMVSYGHRLFCDKGDNELKFRWGNSTVYRKYYQDYQKFLQRPEQIVRDRFEVDNSSWAIITADLSQFYDRVNPSLLQEKLKPLLKESNDPRLEKLYQDFFNWSWHPEDSKFATEYAKRSQPEIEDFSKVALPQGLVAGGFFANIVLLDFDEAIVESFDDSISQPWSILDYCRYVDDMRFVIKLSSSMNSMSSQEKEQALGDSFSDFLGNMLDSHATGLVIKPEKLGVLLGENVGGSKRFAAAMRRINENISGVFDVVRGGETLDLVEGLMLSTNSSKLNPGNRFLGTVLDLEPDVAEQTVSRFAANRFKKIFRTLRPMCDPYQEADIEESEAETEDPTEPSSPATQSGEISQRVLDAKAEHFSAILIEKWVTDPSNMRLLRIAMDLNPSAGNLELVISLLNDHLGKRKDALTRRVVEYCAAELLKAGSTETGLANEEAMLPHSSDLQIYQSLLSELATRLQKSNYPWFLRQQALLFLACLDQAEFPNASPKEKSKEVANYYLLGSVLRNDYANVPTDQLAAYACLHCLMRTPQVAASAFISRFRDEKGQEQQSLLKQVLQEQRQLAIALWKLMTSEEESQWKRLFEDHGVLFSEKGESDSLSPNIMIPFLSVATSKKNPFQQEYTLLVLASKLTRHLETDPKNVIVPTKIMLQSGDWRNLAPEKFPIRDDTFEIQLQESFPDDERFKIPAWVADDYKWAYTLGMLLRVMLTGNPDYTQNRFTRHNSSNIVYRPYRSSWLRRRYGLFNGRNAFGPEWLPISSWIGDLLTVLLCWPGFPVYRRSEIPFEFTLKQFQSLITKRINELENLYGRSSGCPILPVAFPKKRSRNWLDFLSASDLEILRIAVAQTVIPRRDHFETDKQLVAPDYRGLHRRHTAAVLTGVDRMLHVRSTHQSNNGEIDLLVLPELSVHPEDLRTLVLPFVRRNKCMICAGIVFHPVSEDDDRLINVAGWFIPIRKPFGGTEIEVIFQGKQHLTKDERQLGISPFRPAQWIFQLMNPTARNKMLWRLSSAVCYDATDLNLAADLKDNTDMFIVPALNPDVGTFDNMAAALHYHMFQHVVVANSGEFGGSSAHAPFKKNYERTLFHLHGNEQAAIGFFDVNMKTYTDEKKSLKTPPANLKR